MDNNHLGWNAHFQHHFTPFTSQGYAAARVVRAHGGFYTLLNSEGEHTATLSGRLRRACAPGDLPVSGDWVVFDSSAEEGLRIEAVLPRQSALKRAAGGNRKRRTESPGAPQMLAANVDTALIVSGLDRDYNPRRIERYLTLVHESGAAPVIVLNKGDLCPEARARREEIERLSFGVPVYIISAKIGEGVDRLEPHLQPGHTLVLLGSSGAGKSTLLNRLAGAEHQRTASVSEAAGKGTHTTTHRELFPLPGGALVIDTPGVRELHLWGQSEGGLESTFPEIADLAAQCRFRNCLHNSEPGCAIQAALAEGRLEAIRLESYLKQQSQLLLTSRRQQSLSPPSPKGRPKPSGMKQGRRRKDG